MEILIATTNKNKIKEILDFFELNKITKYIFKTLNDFKAIDAPDEIENSLEGNAILKAKYYGKAFNIITMSEDSGLFIDALDGFPGIKSARWNHNKSYLDKCDLIIEMLANKTNRRAHYDCSMAIYNPFNNEIKVYHGKMDGSINTKKVVGTGFGYDPIFLTKNNQPVGSMKYQEKLIHSHRGNALNKFIND